MWFSHRSRDTRPRRTASEAESFWWELQAAATAFGLHVGYIRSDVSRHPDELVVAPQAGREPGRVSARPTSRRRPEASRWRSLSFPGRIPSTEAQEQR